MCDTIQGVMRMRKIKISQKVHSLGLGDILDGKGTASEGEKSHLVIDRWSSEIEF